MSHDFTKNKYNRCHQIHALMHAHPSIQNICYSNLLTELKKLGVRNAAPYLAFGLAKFWVKVPKPRSNEQHYKPIPIDKNSRHTNTNQNNCNNQTAIQGLHALGLLDYTEKQTNLHIFAGKDKNSLNDLTLSESSKNNLAVIAAVFAHQDASYRQKLSEFESTDTAHLISNLRTLIYERDIDNKVLSDKVRMLESKIEGLEFIISTNKYNEEI